MSFITAIGTSNPPNRTGQRRIGAFMEKMMKLDDLGRRKLRAIFGSSGIDTRYSVLEDYGKESGFSFYPSNPQSDFPDTARRMSLFQKNALPLSVAAVRDMESQVGGVDLRQITHLITVTCTGMYAPGLDIDLIRELGLSSSVNRTSITFMGCYAAFNAFKTADAFCKAEPGAKVLIVCTELCSIHFQQEGSDDNLLANALFGDGAAAVLVERTTEAKRALSFRGFANALAPEGEKDMAWSIGNTGFEMKLSSYVPALIEQKIGELTAMLLQKLGRAVTDIRYFAVHPGGKRILAAVEERLGLPPEKNSAAYHVLRNYGNMSSPTVVFVLKELFIKMAHADDGELILSFAFGPGLTLEGMLAEVHCQ